MSSSPSAREEVLERFCSSYNLNLNFKKSDFVRLVCEKNIPTSHLSTVRSSIFSVAQSLGLADKRAVIVSRRGTSLNPLQRKLADDVWELAQCVSSSTQVKRVLLKNGKRDHAYIESKLENSGAGKNDESISENANPNQAVHSPQTMSIPMSMSVSPSEHSSGHSSHNVSTTMSRQIIDSAQHVCLPNISRSVSNNTYSVHMPDTAEDNGQTSITAAGHGSHSPASTF